MKATDVLKKDHAAVKKLFTEFQRTGGRAVKKRQQLVEKIASELEVHAAIEEEIFYPAMREVEGAQDLVEESQEEHQQVKDLIAEIRGMDEESEELPQKVRELRDAVLHHVKEEEGQMFPKARQVGDAQLLELGQRLTDRKKALMGGAKKSTRRSARRAA